MTLRADDEMGTALDGAEAVQRSALEAARALVAQALDALAPFARHDTRLLPGIERAVKDERERLGIVLEHLASIVALHLDAKGSPEPVNEATERVLEMRKKS